jgi:hypothetical protein
LQLPTQRISLDEELDPELDDGSELLCDGSLLESLD